MNRNSLIAYFAGVIAPGVRTIRGIPLNHYEVETCDLIKASTIGKRDDCDPYNSYFGCNQSKGVTYG